MLKLRATKLGHCVLSTRLSTRLRRSLTEDRRKQRSEKRWAGYALSPCVAALLRIQCLGVIEIARAALASASAISRNCLPSAELEQKVLCLGPIPHCIERSATSQYITMTCMALVESYLSQLQLQTLDSLTVSPVASNTL